MNPASGAEAKAGGHGLCPEPDRGLDGDWATALSFENDKIGLTETDSSYTAGVRLARTQAGYSPGSERGGNDPGEDAPAYTNEHGALRWLRRRTKGLENLIWRPLGLWFDQGTEKPTGYRQSVGGGMNIFTPETTTENVVPADERPYAGYHYLFYGLEQQYCDESEAAPGFLVSSKFVSSVEYQAGWIGEQLAHNIIETAHDVWPAGGFTNGWDSRKLNYEPTFNIFYNRVWSGVPLPWLLVPRRDDPRLAWLADPWSDGPFGLGVQFRPHAGFALGNAYTYGSLGTTVRFGLHIPENVGPPTVRPASPGSDYFLARRPGDGGLPFSAYGFVGFERRGVLYNAFLDGNLLSESPEVDKKLVVDDAYWGVALEASYFRLSYTRTQRSPEFDGQGDTTFGALTLGVNVPLN